MSATHFDPNAAAAAGSGIFGLPFSEQEAALVYLPIPWEATTSYGGGTSQGPAAILRASHQVDLFDLDVVRPYEPGLHMLPSARSVLSWNEQAKSDAQIVIDAAGDPTSLEDPTIRSALARVNDLSEQLNQFVREESLRIIESGKLLGVVGGDHSVPFGALQAVAQKHGSFGILHFDAHSDTRKAYEGFEWSHASIMHNVLERIPQVAKLTQVGIRDVCEEEIEYNHSQGARISTFFDRDLQIRKFEGQNWSTICREIVETLPSQIWISFDIDGLDPRYCPHTGTPVPGGTDFQEACYLIGAVVRSGRTIIGFDLNEVAPNLENPDDEWDANVGARLLYKLTAWTLASQKKARVATPA